MYMGALTAAAVGIYVDVPAVLHIPLCILAGFVGGGLWGLLAGWLKVQFGASEIITTVMLNTIAIYFIEFMVTDPARMMEPGGVSGQSNPLLESARLDILLPNTRAHWGIIVGLVCVVLFWLFLWRSKKGYEVRVSGFNMQAAAYSGINTSRNILLVMLLSGGVAGLAGACEVMGVPGRLYALFSPGYGYDGIAVALIGLNSPLGIVFGALRVLKYYKMGFMAGWPDAFFDMLPFLITALILVVTSIRGNSMKNLISIESPLGKALLHHRTGDRVTIPVSDDYSYDVVIREIKDTADDENDDIRGF